VPALPLDLVECESTPGGRTYCRSYDWATQRRVTPFLPSRLNQSWTDAGVPTQRHFPKSPSLLYLSNEITTTLWRGLWLAPRSGGSRPCVSSEVSRNHKLKADCPLPIRLIDFVIINEQPFICSLSFPRHWDFES
jgi:hypothetical protein